MRNKTDNTVRSYKELPIGRCWKEDFFPISRPRHLPSSTESTGLQHELKNRRAISGTLSGAPSTTMIRAIWTSLTVAEAMPDGAAKILVAIADVDALVKKQSALDDHARHNTTSVYTAAEIFPMLPEKLSTDLTSLNYESDRLAIVIEMVIAADGSLQGSDLYRATVRNHAKLAYNSVAGWLEGNGPMPQGIGTVDGLDENLRLQDRVAQKLKALRHVHGALESRNHRSDARCLTAMSSRTWKPRERTGPKRLLRTS